jgi:monothiol glutaredoxin
MDLKKVVEKILSENPVVLFMKGTKNAPMCGFSNLVVEIFKSLEVDFFDVNVMEEMGTGDSCIREFMKDYSDWPTYPQLYVNKELIGGCDIIKALYDSGDLQSILQIKKRRLKVGKL